MGFNRFFGASILSLAILAGCGGGGDGTAPAAGGGGAGGGGGTTTSGQLTNSPIDGVPYTATPSGLTGTTMNGGMFNFQAGDTVTFNIAGLEIAVPGGARITPQTIAEELADGDATTQANILANLTTFFQTIDSDGLPENGSVTIPDNIEFANAADLLTSLEMEPMDFQMAFQTAIDGAYPEGSEPMIVDSEEAMLRFYRNELQGNWRLVSAMDGEETIASSADYQVLLSFDVGNTNAASDGVVNSFVFSEFELSDTEPDFSFVGVGTTNYNSDTAEFQFTSLPRALVPDFTSPPGTNNSSSESDPFLFSSKVALDGNQLVLTLVEQGTTIVATFERFNNVKDSLIGSWYEVLPPELSTGGPTTIAAPAQNGSVDFGEDVASVFYYFLSNSRVMLVFTDLPAVDNGEEANGVIVADYTLANGRLTFTNVLLDSVSDVSAPDPAVADGDFVTVAAATLNDTKRILTEGDTSNEQETYEIYRILSLSERVGAFEQAAPAEAVEAR
ncbi:MULTISPECIES: hypothetical protein [unclassified Limnobacter]|jgi:hypothetical protein|uniref:hypothetical protein n=1 Tax=unclassified Limnobacter TaxID=2630203 RepID=UPI000C601FB3|nr:MULTISPECIES: hypothetical protein [unclassified Limnobacter]MAZ10921.1 hypothetical protein [Sutterellaceae bacterium]|tara:strand:- start:3128 stop:4636 length:1509 start_codon:yes stop_codon:yes gene_type:complete